LKTAPVTGQDAPPQAGARGKKEAGFYHCSGALPKRAELEHVIVHFHAPVGTQMRLDHLIQVARHGAVTG
jgi:catechol-2,3-dioxygenase